MGSLIRIQRLGGRIPPHTNRMRGQSSISSTKKGGDITLKKTHFISYFPGFEGNGRHLLLITNSPPTATINPGVYSSEKNELNAQLLISNTYAVASTLLLIRLHKQLNYQDQILSNALRT